MPKLTSREWLYVTKKVKRKQLAVVRIGRKGRIQRGAFIPLLKPRKV